MKKIWKSERGVAAIEMALITPFLLVLTFGSVEFGVLLFDKAMITNASREGARASIAYNPRDVQNFCEDGVTVQGVVDEYLGGHLISLGGGSPATVTTTLAEADANTGARRICTVDVRYNYNFMVLPDLLAGFFSGGMGDAIPLRAQTVMRMERQKQDQLGG